MKPYTYHIGQLFLLGDRLGFDTEVPPLAECRPGVIMSYITDWLVRTYTTGMINDQDLRRYLNIVEGANPEIRHCLYSWLQADH